MPVVTYTTIGGGLVGPDEDVNRRFSWLERSVLTKKRQVYRRDELKALPDRSLLDQISTAWNALSEAVKSDWNDAGDVIDLRGYNLFVQDKSYRIKNELAGNATPSIYHQYLIGHLNIPAGAGNVLLRQSGSFVFEFPATLKVRRKTVLEADNGNGEFIKVRFKYTYDEGGGETTETTEISLPLADSWDLESSALTEHSGLLGPWELEIETNNIKGDLYFDDLWVEGPGGIFTKDPFCLDVFRYFPRVIFPEAATLETIYPTGGAL